MREHRVTRAAVWVLAILVVASAYAWGSKEAPETNPEPKQGITGKVEIWEGDFMPMTDPASGRNSKTPGAGRRVRVHEPVRMSAGGAQALLAEVPTPLVAEAVCDENGEFYVPTEPGSYSIFVEEGEGWYHNSWDGQGVQGGVTVAEGTTAEVSIKVTVNATF